MRLLNLPAGYKILWKSVGFRVFACEQVDGRMQQFHCTFRTVPNTIKYAKDHRRHSFLFSTKLYVWE
jgi:hypothetical protein